MIEHHFDILIFIIAIKHKIFLKMPHFSTNSKKNIFFDFRKMAFQNQSQSEAVSPLEHLIKMMLAEALFVSFDTDIRLHHGGAENDVKLVFFEHVVHEAKRTIRRFVPGRTVKSFIDWDGINFFHHDGVLPFRIYGSSI